MIGKLEFMAGMVRISAAVRQECDEAALECYHEALVDETTPAEWDAFTRAAVKAGRWEWFPKLRELTDALREFRGEPSLDVEAQQAYERVCSASTYLPEGGDVWIYRDVLERCGRAAADAFQAAGGGSAWGRAWDSGKRQTAFVEAYRATVRAAPETRLLPPGPMLALPSPEDVRLSQQEALEVVARLRQVAEPNRPSLVVEATNERLAVLRRQGQQLLASVADATGQP